MALFSLTFNFFFVIINLKGVRKNEEIYAMFLHFPIYIIFSWYDCMYIWNNRKERVNLFCSRNSMLCFAKYHNKFNL